METEEITRQTLAAWDEEEAQPEQSTAEVEEPAEPEEPELEAEAEPEPTEAEPDEQAEEKEEAEAEEEDEDELEEEEEEEPEEEVSSYQSENPQVQAFLAKYQGDLEKALVGAVQLQQVLGRQGQEKAVLNRRVQELEQELERAKTFSPGMALTPEQRSWIDEAVESQNPVTYVQHAIQAGEYDLARAVCDRWAEDAPYEAGRIAQHVDAVEWRAQQQQQQEEQPPLDSNALMGVLVEHFPEMPQYEQQMLTAMNTLGDNHPLVQDARSNDPGTAATAIVSIYEIARAQTTSVKTARTKLQRDGRKAADEARARAVVSSAQASPSPGETPRPRQIMPGLTLEELDQAWDSK